MEPGMDCKSSDSIKLRLRSFIDIINIYCKIYRIPGFFLRPGIIL